VRGDTACTHGLHIQVAPLCHRALMSSIMGISIILGLHL
jgi:hypothetical protein